MQYEQAFALLQNGKAQDEALERLNKSLEYDPTFGDAYVLKSYVRLEVIRSGGSAEGREVGR